MKSTIVGFALGFVYLGVLFAVSVVMYAGYHHLAEWLGIL